MIIGGKRRRRDDVRAGGPGDPLPGWLVDYLLVGVIPEKRTEEYRAFVHLRYQRSPGAMRDLYLAHRAEIIRESQRLGFVRPDEPYGEHIFARDEKGMPLPLPPGVERIEEGEPSPWWASRADPSCQAILRQQLREQRGLADDGAA